MVQDGYAAIQMAKGTRFDIVFIDVMLLKIDGLQTFEEIKKINLSTNVIMLTGQR